MSQRKDAMKEFMKFYLSDIIFDTSNQCKIRVQIMYSIIQIICLVLLVASKFIFKDNEVARNTSLILFCVIVWIMLVLTIITNIIVSKVQKKISLKQKNYFKYLDELAKDDKDEDYRVGE